MAAGAAAGKFLQYETDAPTMAAQTAYGIQVGCSSEADVPAVLDHCAAAGKHRLRIERLGF